MGMTFLNRAGGGGGRAEPELTNTRVALVEEKKKKHREMRSDHKRVFVRTEGGHGGSGFNNDPTHSLEKI